MKRGVTVWLFVGAVLGSTIWYADVSQGQTLGSALPMAVGAPPTNPSTPARVALGRILFWDPILSGERDVACGTCHHPRFGTRKIEIFPSAPAASASAAVVVSRRAAPSRSSSETARRF